MSFAFPNLFRNSLSISAKKPAEISCRDWVKLVSQFGRKPSQQAHHTTLLISRICIFSCSIQSLRYFHYIFLVFQWSCMYMYVCVQVWVGACVCLCVCGCVSTRACGGQRTTSSAFPRNATPSLREGLASG